MYYSYVENEYVATSFSPARMDLAVKLLKEHENGKKDRTKDLHASIKIMIENASAATHDKSEELCSDFISLYSSKTHGGLNIQLHQLFEDAGMGNVVFAKGVSTNLWAGNFGRAHKSAPGAFSPFSFSKMKALSASGNNRNRSLLINVSSAQKEGLMKNIDDIKASAKTTVSVSQISTPSSFKSKPSRWPANLFLEKKAS
jgi:hypothetical protein